MTANVVGTGLEYRRQAEISADKASQLETSRNQQNMQIEAAKKSQQGGLAGMGAAVGWAAGAQAGSVGGPWGALIGAGLGYLAGEFL